MKKQLNFVNLKVFSVRYESDGVISLKDPSGFASFVKKYSWRLVSLSTLTSRFTLANRIRLFYNFSLHLFRLKRHHGEVFVVKYLKACQLALQKKVAGTPLNSLREVDSTLPFPRLTRSKLPRVIGLRDRRAIGSLSVNTVRLYSTLFSIYRVIKVAGTLKLSTITDPFKGNSTSEFLLCNWFRQETVKLLGGKIPIKKVSCSEILPLEKSSPSNSVSWRGVLCDSLAIRYSNIFPAFSRYCNETDSTFLLQKVESCYQDFLKSGKESLSGLPFKDFLLKYQSSPNEIGHFSIYDPSTYPLGQLAEKLEAAGKVRVFAMVDIITQSLLFPLHSALGDILRSLPNDGTFDQDASFKRSIQKSKLSGCSYGYDLSAATDRLPLTLQKAILASLLSPSIAESWGDLLTSRVYWRNLTSTLETGSEKSREPVRYAVGQPMGALSSWNMLAITHHMILQYCAVVTGVHVNGSWYENYEVLGDDIAIFDSKVASKYLEVCSTIGLDINLSKSVVSCKEDPVVEFAKRTSLHGKDVSAISWKMIASQDNLYGRCLIANKLYNQGLTSDFAYINTLASRVSKYNLGSMNFNYVSFLVQQYTNRRLKLDQLIALLVHPDDLALYFSHKIIPAIKRNEIFLMAAQIRSGDFDLRKWGVSDEREFVAEAYTPILIEYFKQEVEKLLRKVVSDRHFSSAIGVSNTLWDRRKVHNLHPDKEIMPYPHFSAKDIAYELVSEPYQYEAEELMRNPPGWNAYLQDWVVYHSQWVDLDTRLELPFRDPSTVRRIEIDNLLMIVKFLIKATDPKIKSDMYKRQLREEYGDVLDF